MISEAYADLIMSVIKAPAPANPEDIKTLLQGFRGDGNDSVKSPVAVIPVLGALSYRGYNWYSRSTYQDIRENFRSALNNADIEAIVFDIDSPGGEVAGVFDLADEIYNARGEKPIYAIANESAYSAAYAIASAADDIFLSRTGNVGSIGVIAMHSDWSKYDEKLGVKYTAIYAGERKNDFNPDEPLSKEAHRIAQNRVNQVYDIFVETVARNRDLPVDAVRKTEAGIYRGQDALDAELADEVMSWEEAMEKILKTYSIERSYAMLTNIPKLKSKLESFLADDAKKEDVVSMLADLGFIVKPENAQAEIDKLIAAAQTEGEKSGHTAGEESGRQTAIDYAVEVAQICQLAGTPEMAADLMKAETPIEEVRKKVVAAKADQSSKVEIASTVSATSVAEPDVLLADAQRRAQENLAKKQ